MAYQTDYMTSYGYGHCDSYFVEKHDDDEGVYAKAAADRERARAVGRAQQKHIAQELSLLTAELYQDDILAHMETMEAQTMPDINSIEIQTEIQWFMRPYLLDFLLEAHHAFQLLPDTLFLAVNLLDRYCSRRVVYKRHYQLVGCAALLIAAKYGDRKERVPTIRELKSMCCSLYDDDMFTQMEWHVLQTLDWIIGAPTVSSFLDHANSEAPFDQEVECMALYISENALYHKEFVSVQPSVMARSSLALAKVILGRPQVHNSEWSSRYDATVVMDLSNHLSLPSQALFRKYASAHLSSVSTTLEVFLQQQALIAKQQRQQQEEVQYAMAHRSDSVYQDTLLVPSTPQKPGYPAVPVGVLTPPITPDKFQLNGVYGTSQNLLPHLSACVPTPPSSTAHQQQQYCYAQYPPSQYMQ